MWKRLFTFIIQPPLRFRMSTSTFDFVCVGGTFDRIHAGHTKLLTECVNRCNKKLTVGVTDESMVTKKVLPELILPCQKRMDDVTEHLKSLKSDLEYNVVPISDPFGPAIVDETLQAIVGSKETERGCLAVNRIREEKQMKPLEIVLVDLIMENKQSQFEEDKVSSSSQRMRLLGSELKKPEKAWDPEQGPYLIGLIGGSASGKTSVGQRLEKLGAGVINCDALGHRAYEPGTDCFNKIVSEFDEGELLDADGKINRIVLSKQVFSNPDKRSKLNNLVWPEVWRLANQESQSMAKSGKKIVIFDAALLVQAGWHKEMHQIFVCIVDREEAIKRIMERDGKTEDEAKARLDSQPANSELVKHAHVVFSTMWNEDFTQTQVEKAWKKLQDYVEVEGEQK